MANSGLLYNYSVGIQLRASSNGTTLLLWPVVTPMQQSTTLRISSHRSHPTFTGRTM